MILQMSMFMRMGYQVVLLTKQIDTTMEYPLPAGAERGIIPKQYDNGRAEACNEVIKQHHIDAIVHHASFGKSSSAMGMLPIAGKRGFSRRCSFCFL